MQHLLRVVLRTRYFRAGEGYSWAYGPWAQDYYRTRSGRIALSVERHDTVPAYGSASWAVNQT